MCDFNYKYTLSDTPDVFSLTVTSSLEKVLSDNVTAVIMWIERKIVLHFSNID
jgi:hypothetical protein